MNSEKFIKAYIECALWTSTDETGDPLEDYEVAEETKDKMAADCRDFLGLLEREELVIEYNHPEYTDDELAGHDFWMSRNRHGCGYWDRGIGELGGILHQWAKTYGSQDLYVGDDGLVYCS